MSDSVSDIPARLEAALADRYRIEEKIGEGGMAVVFLAEDLKHGRKVALKVLRAELAAIVGGERFLQEIEVTAQLQHPNILPLYDSGEADGFLFYVMPLMEGETLREKLDREGQLPVDEAVEIAGSVAAALDYAHRHDVIHRDIKPPNILLHDGQALVADFGIALAMRQAGGTRLTETGLSVGTPHYMSPEQAAGDRELDARSDLYSLGAVTYEMLVGEPPHVGKTAQAVVAKILSDTPAPIRRTRELLPRNIEAAVQKALARSPADRFVSAAEFADALENPGFTLPTAAGAGEEARAADTLWRRVGPAVSVVAAAALALALWGWLRSAPEGPVARYGLAFPAGEEPVDVLLRTFDVAPDGSFIAYVGPGEEGNQLWIKPRESYTARPLPGTSGALSPTVSPDAQWVSFVAGGELRKVPVQGGSSIMLADSAQPWDQAWLDDGTLVYSDVELRLRRISIDGGPSEVAWSPESEEPRAAFSPAPIPGSRGVLFTLCDANCNNLRELRVLDLRTGEARSLVAGPTYGRHVRTGHVVFVRPDGGVFAAPFDADALELTGPAVPVLEGVKVDGDIVPDLALAADGTLLMRAGQGAVPGPDEELVWVDREGVVRPVDPGWLVSHARNFGWDLSPDGTRLAIGLSTDEGDDIWIKELDDGPLTRLTYHETEDARPRWGPDGRYVYFLGRRNEDARGAVYRKRADGAGPAEPVLSREGNIWDIAFSPGGEWLVARLGGTTNQTGGRDLAMYSLAGDTAETPIVSLEYDEVAPRVSPDGRWLAYASQESGRWEVYVRPFPDVEAGRWQVSTSGGAAPLWAHSGRELFYVSPDREMMAARIDAGGGFRVEAREALFRLPNAFMVSELNTPWDVAPDDRRFIMSRDAGAEEEVDAPFILVENWFEELEDRVGR